MPTLDTATSNAITASMNTSTTATPKVLLHLHIPKTGGTTLKKLLEKQLFSDDAGPVDVDPSIKRYYQQGVFYYPRGIEEQHRRGVIDPSLDPEIPSDIVHALRDPALKAVLGHFSFGIHSHIQRPAKYITLLRHPIDRVLSLYFHILKWPRTELQKHIAREEMSLEQFVTESGYLQADNGQTRRLAGEEPAFGCCSDELLESAKRNLAGHITVGLTERFDESIVVFRRTFGWPLKLRYWKRLVNKERPREEALSKGTLDTLRKYSSLDLRLYDYACEVFERQTAAAGSDFEEEVERVRSENVKQV